MSQKRQAAFNGFGRGQVRVLSWDYPPNERLAPHRHDWHQFVYAITGVMTVETPVGRWTVPTGRAVWLPARVLHGIDMAGAVAMRALYLSPRLPRVLPDECRVVSVPALLHALLLHAIDLGGLDRRVPTQAHLIEVLLDQIIALPADPLRIDHVRDPRADRVARRVLEHPGERVTLLALTEDAGASKRTIERVFLDETGMSFGRWRQRVRLLTSLRLLAAGQSVTSVALDVGYDSVSAFVSSFRKMFGTTPHRYARGGDA